MPDIFVSYRSTDRPRVRPLVRALVSRGWSVWWDRQIEPTKVFERDLLRSLRRAKCVLVLWSEDAVTSEWVLREARAGHARGVLVSVSLDRTPSPVAAPEALRLSGDASDEREIDEILSAVRRTVDHAPDVLLYDESPHHQPALTLQRLLDEPSWTVWRRAEVGDTPRALEQAAQRAKVLVPVWREDRPSATLLRAARQAERRNRLVPVRVDPATPPDEFASLQTPTPDELALAGGGPWIEQVRARIERPQRYRRMLDVLMPVLIAASVLSLILAYMIFPSATWRLNFGFGIDWGASPPEPVAWGILRGATRWWWLVEAGRSVLVLGALWYLLRTHFLKESLWLALGPAWKPPFKIAGLVRGCRIGLGVTMLALFVIVAYYHLAFGPADLRTWAAARDLPALAQQFSDSFGLVFSDDAAWEYYRPYRYYLGYSLIVYLSAFAAAFAVLLGSLEDWMAVSGQRRALRAQQGLPPFGRATPEAAMLDFDQYEEALLSRSGRYVDLLAAVSLFALYERFIGSSTLANAAVWLAVLAVAIFLSSLAGLAIMYRKYQSVLRDTLLVLRATRHPQLKHYQRDAGVASFALKLFNRQALGLLVMLTCVIVIVGPSFC